MKTKLERFTGSNPPACSPSYYTFRNSEGREIQLRGDLTMEDMVRMGWTNIRLVKPETPLTRDDWRCDFCGETPLTDKERKYMTDHGDEIPVENAKVVAAPPEPQ